MIALATALFILAAPPATPTPAPGGLVLDAPPAPPAGATPAPADAATPAPTPPPAPAPTPDVLRGAIVVVGEDPAEAGGLQREIERRLPGAVPGLTLRYASDVAARIAIPQPAAIPPPIDAAVAAQLNQAIGAYYQAEFVRALDLFAKVQGAYQSAGAPVSKRTEVYLWRVAVFLKLNDSVQARSEALAALALNPELRVDPRSEIPPSVQQELDRVRASASYKLVTVLVNGLPPTASLTIDGRSVPSRFKVLAGKHVLVASSQRRRAVVREFETQDDIALTVSLPLSLDAASDAAVGALVWADEGAGGGATPAEPPAIEAMAGQLEADWVVFAAIRGGQARAVVRRSSDGSILRTEIVALADAAEALTRAAGEHIAEALEEKTEDPRVGTPWVDDGGWTVSTVGTLVASAWMREISGGESFQTFLGGAGPELRVEATKGRFLAVGAGSWISYDASAVEVKLPDGSRTSTTGGSTAKVLVGAGWRGFGEDGDRFRALFALDVENHGASDPTNGGAPLNLLTGYTRAAAELRAGIRLRAPGLPAWRLELDAGVAPYAYFVEDPDGASGDRPVSGPAYLWGAGLESAPTASSRWGLRAAYRGEMRSVRFLGTSSAAVSPPMRDAVLSEMFHTVSFAVTRRF